MSEPIRVKCPHCSAALKLRNRDYLKRTIQCPGCKQAFQPQEEPQFDSLEVIEDDPLDDVVAPHARHDQHAESASVASRSTGSQPTNSISEKSSSSQRPVISETKKSSANSPASDEVATVLSDEDFAGAVFDMPPPPPKPRTSPIRSDGKEPPKTKSGNRDKRGVDEELDDDFDDDRETKSRATKSRKKRKPGFLSLKAVVGLVVAVVVGSLTYTVAYNLVAHGSFSSKSNSATGIAESLSSELVAAEHTLGGLAAGRDRNQVVIDLQGHDAKIHAIYLKALQLDPVDETQNSTLQRELAVALADISTRRQNVYARMNGEALGNQQMMALATSIETSVSATGRMLQNGLVQPADSKNETANIQADYARIQREALQTIAAVRKQPDYLQASAQLHRLADQLEQLPTRIRSLTGQQLTDYEAAFRIWEPRQQFLENEIVLVDRGVMLRLASDVNYQQAFVRFRQHAQAIRYAHLGNRANNPNLANGPPGVPQLPDVGGFPNLPNGVPPGVNPADFPPIPGFPPGGLGPPDFGPPNFGPPGRGKRPIPDGPRGARGDRFPAMANSVEEFANQSIQQFGADNVVILYVPGAALTDEQQTYIDTQMQATFGNFQSSRRQSGGRAGTTMFSYTVFGNLKDISQKLTFVKVLKIDEKQRRIDIEPLEF